MKPLGVRLGLVVIGLLTIAGSASAQIGRIVGTVQDDGGRPIRGASIRAENPDATPNSFSTTTDESGRFSLIGLRTGQWKLSADAPGFAGQAGVILVTSLSTPATPVTFSLPKGIPGPTGALARLNTKDLQADLEAADTLFDAGQYDQAISAYQEMLEDVPTLTLINLQIGNAYRMKREYDKALAAYENVLKGDPANERARVQIGMTQLEQGDVTAAEATLAAAGALPGAGRDVFFSLGEVKFAKNEPDEAAKYYQMAFDADPTWARPLLKLGLVALNKGDRRGAIAFMEKVVAVDPQSPESAQAKAIIGQLATP